MSKNPKNSGKPSRAVIGDGQGANKGDATSPAQPQSTNKPAAEGDHTRRLGNHNVLPHRDPSGARGNEDRRAGAERDKTKR